MSLKAVRGHEKIVGFFQRAVQTGRLASAYLFSGPEGIGKRLVALSLARDLLCEERGGESCGRCAACTQVREGTHPDLILVESLKGIIPVDRVRQLKHELSRKSFSGGCKLCVVDGAERMNVPAQNALLKTIEEPSPETVIILITAQPYVLLPTILSRCQHMKFQLLPLEVAADLITEKAGCERATALLRAAISGGSPGKALALNLEYFLELRRVWGEAFRSSQVWSWMEIFPRAKDLAQERENLQLPLNFLRLYFRDLLVLKATGSQAKALNQEWATELVSEARLWKLEGILEALKAIETYHRAIEQNANPQLSVEALLLRLSSVNATLPGG